MGKIIQGIKNTKGKFIGEQEVEDPTCLYKSDVIVIIGKKNWAKFSKWMTGQGAPIMSDGTMGYFAWDVEKFKRHYIDGVPILTREQIGDILNRMEITGTVGGRTNTRKWNSKKEDIKNDQHSPKKKWKTHFGLKRTKIRWNKKKGIKEKSKKGSRDRIVWAD